MEIDNEKMERVQENKFLGLLIDHKLCWKLLIKNLCSKVARSIAILFIYKNIQKINAYSVSFTYFTINQIRYHEKTNQLILKSVT